MKKRIQKVVALFLAINLLVEIFSPTVALAVTGGPQSPEFSTFTPVTTTDMVNIPTGDFNYNLPVISIPGAEGGGYALSLSYNSGVSPEQEASWVGFGWTLNPGSINRNLRGFPDDFAGEPIKYYNKTRPNWSLTKVKTLGLEAFSIDVSFGNSIRYNNHQGYFGATSFGISAKGVGLNMNLDANGVTFSPSISPLGFFSKKDKETGEMVSRIDFFNNLDKKKVEKGKATKAEVKEVMKANLKNSAKSIPKSILGGRYGLYSYSDAARATTFKKFKGFNINFSFGVQGNPLPIPVGAEGGYQLNVNMQYGLYEHAANAFGFMNSSRISGDNPIMDYYMEKEGSYDKKDVFIGMPFSNADIFAVSGEGIMGGFRAYNQKVGSYKPEKAGDGESKINVVNLGAEFMAGTNIGGGVDLGVGHQKTKLEDWGDDVRFGNENYFRFNNDLGGEIEYGSNNDELQTANVRETGWIPGAKKVKLSEDHIYKSSDVLNEKAGSASYIEYNTFGEINANNENSFSRQLNSTAANYQTQNLGEDLIAEYKITNENGEAYIYSDVLLVRNETNLSMDVNKLRDNIVNNYLAFRKTPLRKNPTDNTYGIENNMLRSKNYQTIMGQINENSYASAYLLTQILKPNFVDVNNNGPDESDFGGWTKFKYRKVYGGTSDWYRFRTPYNGLIYAQNSISDQEDDMGTVITGEKEVAYLEVVETKTHIAFFVTNNYIHDKERYGSFNVGNGSAVESPEMERKDGLSAPELTAAEDPAASSDGNVKGDKKLEYLEKIVLFAKNRPRVPIKTVKFEYDYSLIPNTPNNEESDFNYRKATSVVKKNTGRLTLKRLWFEYEGTAPARISPYEFFYEYRRSSFMRTGREYFEEFDVLSNGQGSEQNPKYSPEFLDPWGKTMPYAVSRKKKNIPWIYQGNDISFGRDIENSWRKDAVKEPTYDPAAWHLKYIKLPSGGEIHIQYEQKDYTHVQDLPAMAMASLIEARNSYVNPYFVINVDDLGCDPYDEEAVITLKDKITAYFEGLENSKEGEYTDKVYYKFLFDLVNSDPSTTGKSSEYIDGYAAFSGAEIKEYTSGDGKKYYGIMMRLDNSSSTTGESASTPRQAAYDFYANQRVGLLNENDEYLNPDHLWGDEFTKMANTEENDLLTLGALILSIGTVYSAAPPWALLDPSEGKVASSISLSQSFIKLPMSTAKKGGGVRVKRLMMYDNGIENGDAQIYGQEFHYVLNDGVTSSGVATNEPGSAREENPLVRMVKKGSQSVYSLLTAGENKEQVEGPLGESLLPPAAVYHSRVVVESIHSAKKESGFTVHEYYTTKDYPFEGYYGCKTSKDKGVPVQNCSEIQGFGVEKTNLQNNTVKDILPAIPTGLITFSVNNLWMAQGFRFIMNSMNGLNKRITVYGGKYYKPINSTEKDTDQGYVVSTQEYDYFEPGEQIRMIRPSEAGGFEEYFDTPGKETEIATEKKQIKNNVFEVSVEIDLSVGFAVIPIPFVSAFPSLNLSREGIATHATTKVISYPSILKSITTTQDGRISRNENLAFNPSNGKPLITKSYDGYSERGIYTENGHNAGEIYQFNIPADWVYQEMGQKATAPASLRDQYSNQLNANVFSVTTYGNPPTGSWLTGDAIENVIAASVNTYSKDWTSSWEDSRIASRYDISVETASELNTVWRPKANYIYKVDQQNNNFVSTPSKKVYNSGYFDLPSIFSWTNENENEDWTKLEEIMKYSPHGIPLESKDVLNIPSAVLFGSQYNFDLPVMIAENAEYSEIFFNDYENQSGISPVAHSGNNALQYYLGMPIVDEAVSTRHLRETGAILKCWIAEYPGGNTEPAFSIRSNGYLFNLEQVAKNGIWTLYECIIPGRGIPAIGNEIEISLNGYEGAETFYVDDIRFQPYDSQASCFIYDPKTNKLLTQFDDQHFGLFYKFNQQGTLTHKIIETERGVQTIQETHYNTVSTTR